MRGTVAELRAAGVPVAGARLAISGDVPLGSGLSSSAALEAALSLALLGVAGVDEPDRVELAKLCSRVENDWVGAETGLLDQLASLCSRAGEAIRIDFAALALAPRPAGPRRLAAGHARLGRASTGTPPAATTSAAPSAARRPRRSGWST